MQKFVRIWAVKKNANFLPKLGENCRKSRKLAEIAKTSHHYIDP
jgi:hypothetical protein